MLLQKLDLIQQGKDNGDGTILRYRTGKGSDIYCLGVPLSYSSGEDWDLGPTWCYLIKGKQNTLIDTGQFDKSEELESMLKKVGCEAKHIDNIVVTHGHEDHDGNVQEVQQAGHARLWAHFAFGNMISYHPGVTDGALHPDFPGSCRCCLLPDDFNSRCLGYHEKRSRLKIDHEIREETDTPDKDLRFILTPGHSPDSLCGIYQDEVMFSGDTLLASITPHPSLVIEYYANKSILPEGYGGELDIYGLMAYIGSLDKLQRQYGDIDLLLPAHRLVEKGRINYLRPAERAAEIICFHRERCGNILRILGDRVLGLDDIAIELFDPRLRKGWGKYMSQREVMSHLELLAVCGDVEWVEGNKFTSRATGSANYLQYFAKNIKA
jgi:glyoxylase-like metal-dependent hydrolase (beta-lactamase superfamily II)